MKSFAYVRPKTVDAAIAALAEGGLLKGNGLDLLDRMKERVDEPDRVVTLIDAGLARMGPPWVASRPGGDPAFLPIWSMATLADIAGSTELRDACPALVEAAREAASPQLRNRATVGGNLAQHTRCGYYRHKSFPCWKRGSDHCPVLKEGAVQETAAIFGNGSCASAHPSSLAPALAAAGATVVVRGPKAVRRLAIADLYEAPRQGKPGDTVLGPDEVIVVVEVPAARRSAFIEVRRRAAFDWALVSCAASIEEKDGKVSKASIWLGSVAPTPHRAKLSESSLLGVAFDEMSVKKASEAAVVDAKPLPGNAYKVDLVKVVVRRALVAAHGRR